MTALLDDLRERRGEFDEHYALALALQSRMMLESDSSLGSLQLSVRHINTIKSGLIVHIYNIEESIMSKALDFLGDALGASPPARWTEYSFREWIRGSLIKDISEATEDTKIARIHQSSTLLIRSAALGPQKLAKPSGTWDDKVIAIFLRRMSINCRLSEEMWRRIASRPELGDQTPLQFIAKLRNSIAHGVRSFEQAAASIDLPAIRELADVVLDYLEYIAAAIHAHVDQECHLAPP